MFRSLIFSILSELFELYKFVKEKEEKETKVDLLAYLLGIHAGSLDKVLAEVYKSP